MAEIIKFPKANPNVSPMPILTETAQEDFRDRLDDNAEHVAAVIIKNLVDGGYEYSPSMIKDMLMIIESTRAFIYKYHGQSHPFHQFAEAFFHVDDQHNIQFVPFKMKTSSNDDPRPE